MIDPSKPRIPDPQPIPGLPFKKKPGLFSGLPQNTGEVLGGATGFIVGGIPGAITGAGIGEQIHKQIKPILG
jgi:hypothetical protein